jgi:hypothetical protein
MQKVPIPIATGHVIPAVRSPAPLPVHGIYRHPFQEIFGVLIRGGRCLYIRCQRTVSLLPGFARP